MTGARETCRDTPAAAPTQGSGRLAALRGEARGLARLAGPIAFVQLGNTLLGAVDLAVVGRLGTVPLAAVGMGQTFFFSVSCLGLGVMVGLDPLMAQAVGARKAARARALLWQSVWLAVGIAVPLSLIYLGLVGLLGGGQLGLDPAVARETAVYLLWRLPGVLPYLLLLGTRTYLQAHDVTRPMVVGVVLANLVNLPASFLLVFGDEALEMVGLSGVGLPGFGVAGAALASALSTVLQAGVTAAACARLRDGPAPESRRPDRALLLAAVGLGLPIAGAIFAEVLSFALVTYFVGRLGAQPLAAHNVALNWVGITFQVPLAIGIASTVRVGRAVGAEDPPAVRRAGVVALGTAAGLMAAFGVGMIAFPGPLARVVTDVAEIVVAAGPLFAVAAGFQVADGLQVVGSGALRGLGDTRFPFLANLVGHYALGVPVGLGLGYGLGWGAVGLWLGLSAGLGTVAIALVARFLRRTRSGAAIARVGPA